MTDQVFVNGRFLTQPITGVQRFAREVTTALARLADQGALPETMILTPGSAQNTQAVASHPSFGLPIQAIGRTGGHLWEQTELPWTARHGIVLGLGNTGPLLAGHRQVVVIHDAGVFDVPGSYSRPFRVWYRTMQRQLVRGGAHIVTVSEFSRQRILAHLAIPASRITVAYEGAEHVLRATTAPEILDRHGLRPGRFVLVIGAGADHKNLAALHRLAAALPARDMVLAIVGMQKPPRFAARGTGTWPTSRTLGRVTDGELRSLYEAAACLVFPSRYEGFGLPPLEAMTCGCPVIATRGGAVEEICGVSAVYADATDPDSLVRLSWALFDDPARASALRSTGRTHAGRFSWEKTARTLAAVALRAAHGPRGMRSAATPAIAVPDTPRRFASDAEMNRDQEQVL